MISINENQEVAQVNSSDLERFYVIPTLQFLLKSLITKENRAKTCEKSFWAVEVIFIILRNFTRQIIDRYPILNFTTNQYRIP